MRLNPRVLLLTPRRFATALPDFAFAPRPRAAPRRSLADAELAAMADEIIAMSRPEFLAKYGNQISAKLQALGFSSVDEFLAAKEGRRREENAKVLLGLRRDGDRMDVLKVKEMGAGGAAARPKAKAAKPAEAQAGPAQAAGMAPKPLSSIIQMDKFAQLDAEKMEELWKAYHADKDVLCAVVPVEAYDKIMRNGRDFPVVRFLP